MKSTCIAVSLHLITRVLILGMMLGVANGASAEDKNVTSVLKIPSKTKGIPDWKEAAKRIERRVKIKMLPDLVPRADTQSDPCSVELSIRNNSFNGITREQWASRDSVVRLQVLNYDTGELVADYDMRLSAIDPDRDLTHRGGETRGYPWRVTAGNWKVTLDADVQGNIPEYSESNNIVETYLWCHPTK